MSIEIQQLNQDQGLTLSLKGTPDATGASAHLRALTPHLRKKLIPRHRSAI